MSYLEDHRELLVALFDALGKDADWSDDPEVLVSHTLPRWLGTEHGSVGSKEHFTPAQIEAARPILAELGLTRRIEPSADTYDEIVVLGAAGIGLHRRLELVRTSQVSAAQLTVLAGMRPHVGAAGSGRDGRIGELLAADGRFAAAPGWHPPVGLVHRARLLLEVGVDEDLAAQILLPSETDLARLLLTKQWPELRCTQIVPACDAEPEPSPELGHREVLRYEWEGPPHLPQARVLNGAPVARPHGPPRPTTASTLEEWIEQIPSDPDPRRVLFVVNQPHLGRVSLVLDEILGPLDAPTVQVEIAGCETLPNVGIHLLLGEIPARIAAEKRRKERADAGSTPGLS